MICMYNIEFRWTLFPAAHLTGEQAASEWSYAKSNKK